MRLFVALVPPAEAVAPLRAAVDTLRPTAPGWRWSDPVRWHLTLAFLGEVAEQQLPALDAALGEVAARAGPVDLRLAGAGAFPGRRAARVLWAGLRGDLDRLVALAGSAQRAAAAALDRTAEPRAYRPHLTLARSGRGPLDATPAVSALAPVAGPGWTAHEVLLVRSHLGGGPARHEPLAVHGLSGPG